MKKYFFAIIAILFALSLLICINCNIIFADSGDTLWTADGVAIATLIQGTDTLPRIISDNCYGTISIWVVLRYLDSAWNTFLYGQKLNSDSREQWTSDGLAIASVAVEYGIWEIELTSDGSGGIITTWQDKRTGTLDIYAQRVDANGNIQWPNNGVAICTETNIQREPEIVSDETGGAIITWEDLRSGIVNLYAQRINANGITQWTENGVGIATEAYIAENPKITTDNNTGAIIVWKDSRNGNYDIYAQRVNSSGTIQWGQGGIGICQTTGTQDTPQLIPDGAGGTIISWRDYRDAAISHYDIYAQKVNPDGTIAWDTDGIAICTAIKEQRALKIVSDQSRGAIIVWQDYRSDSKWNVYAQKINSAGAVQWTANGVAIGTDSLHQGEVDAVSDGNGGALIAWQLYNDTDEDIYAQHINGDGEAQWQAYGIDVCALTEFQSDPRIASDGKSGACIIWEDKRDGTNWALYGQRIEGPSIWYFAEGTTTGTFEEWLTVQNPTDLQAEVQFTFMKTDSSTAIETTSIAGTKRYTLDASSVSGLESADFSTKVESTNGTTIVAERSMYWNSRIGGHDTIGATMPSTLWYLAEGNTRTGYEEWVTIQNPQNADATIEITAMTGDSSEVVYQGTVEGTKRFNYNPAGNVTAGNDCSLKITSTNSVPIVVERTMYWDNTVVGNQQRNNNKATLEEDRRIGGNNTIAAMSPALTWYFAEGTTREPYIEWMTVQNPNTDSADVTITFMKSDSSTASTTTTILGGRRYTMNASSVLGTGIDASVKIESTNGVGIIAERPMYFENYQGGHITIGANSPAETWYFAE